MFRVLFSIVTLALLDAVAPSHQTPPTSGRLPSIERKDDDGSFDMARKGHRGGKRGSGGCASC